MDLGRIIAGVGIFSLASILALQGHTEQALYLALPTVAFFVGEKNGSKPKT